MGDERQRRLDWKFITASAAPFAGTCIAARQKSHDVRRQRPFTASEAVVRIASLGFLPADHSDSLEIHRNCEFTEMRRRSAKRKDLGALRKSPGICSQNQWFNGYNHNLVSWYLCNICLPGLRDLSNENANTFDSRGLWCVVLLGAERGYDESRKALRRAGLT